MLAVQGRDDGGISMFELLRNPRTVDHLALSSSVVRLTEFHMYTGNERTPKEAKNAATVGGALHLKSNEYENL